jgi:hypothetical protein
MQVLIGVHIVAAFVLPASLAQHLGLAAAMITVSSLVGIDVTAESHARTVKQVCLAHGQDAALCGVGNA